MAVAGQGESDSRRGKGTNLRSRGKPDGRDLGRKCCGERGGCRMGRPGWQRGGTASPRAAIAARVLRGRAAAASPAVGVHSSAALLGAAVGTGSQGCETSQGENCRAQGVGERAFCKGVPLPTRHGHAPASVASRDRKGSDL